MNKALQLSWQLKNCSSRKGLPRIISRIHKRGVIHRTTLMVSQSYDCMKKKIKLVAKTPILAKERLVRLLPKYLWLKLRRQRANRRRRRYLLK